MRTKEQAVHRRRKRKTNNGRCPTRITHRLDTVPWMRSTPTTLRTSKLPGVSRPAFCGVMKADHWWSEAQCTYILHFPTSYMPSTLQRKEHRSNGNTLRS